MFPKRLSIQYSFMGAALTWVVGLVIGLVGYEEMIKAVRREAIARVEEASRVGLRLLELEFTHLDPDGLLPSDATLLVMPVEDVHPDSPLYPLARKALHEGKANGFALLDEGLSLVSVRRDPGANGILAAIRSLREANGLTDQIREVVFGRSGRAIHSATITIFEKDVRIATNVMLPDGRRATGTRVSEAVAGRVLATGQPWNDRAFVVGRWMIASYLPVRDLEGNVVGMFYAGLDETPYIAQQKRNILLFLAFILGLTLIISAGSGYLGRRIALPLVRLTEASAALGRGDRRHIEASSGDPEEIRMLAAAFNQMADQIHEKTASLEASSRMAKKALEDYMEVLGFVAHELKSPISGALTQLGVVEGGYLGEIPPKMAGILAGVRRSLEYGHEMALSFNNLSRVESEGFAPRKRALADFCQEVIRPAIADQSPHASQGNMTIILEGEPMAVQADPGLMRVVMDNLIGNAVKYGRTGTEIQVKARKIPRGIRVEVANQGVGVPRERFGELFQKFHRIQDPQLTSRKGTGVGLYLVKKIVELHGGRVGVDGEYGSWIMFWFEIPDGDASESLHLQDRRTSDPSRP